MEAIPLRIMATYLAVRAEAATGTSLSMKFKFVYDGGVATSGNTGEGLYNEFIVTEAIELEIYGVLIFEAVAVILDSFTSVVNGFIGYCMLG